MVSVIRFRLDSGFAVDLLVPVMKVVNGYKEVRRFLLNTKFRLPALARAVGEPAQAFFYVMGIGTEEGIMTVDVR